MRWLLAAVVWIGCVVAPKAYKDPVLGEDDKAVVDFSVEGMEQVRLVFLFPPPPPAVDVSYFSGSGCDSSTQQGGRVTLEGLQTKTFVVPANRGVYMKLIAVSCVKEFAVRPSPGHRYKMVLRYQPLPGIESSIGSCSVAFRDTESEDRVPAYEYDKCLS